MEKQRSSAWYLIIACLFVAKIVKVKNKDTIFLIPNVEFLEASPLYVFIVDTSWADEVKIRVKKVDLAKRQIDFTLIS